MKGFMIHILLRITPKIMNSRFNTLSRVSVELEDKSPRSFGIPLVAYAGEWSVFDNGKRA